jgi:FMN reductase
MKTIMVVSAGLGQPSSTRLLGERLAVVTRSSLGEAGVPAEFEHVELRAYATDLTNQLLTGVPSARLAALLTRVADADGLIAVTPIFNASFSGLFKIFLDALEPGALHGTPTVIAATAGTARHSLALDHALRPLFTYLGAVSTPTAVFAATEDWASPGELTRRIARAGSELADLVERPPLNRRDSATAEVIPFAQLLGRAAR